MNNGLPDSFDLELSISPEMEGCMVGGDADLLLRAFRNLTGNSIRHNPDGCRIELTARQAAGMAELTFSDSGQGIPLAVIKALYQPSPQKHIPSAPHVMGLRIVKQIVEAHQGQIEFALEKDVCRLVKIRLPLLS